VQQGRIGRANSGGDQRVRLVTGGADRVEALAALAHPPGLEVQHPAGRHRVEGGQRRFVGGTARRARQGGERVAHSGVEIVVRSCHLGT
jgi:hypothetical protein